MSIRRKGWQLERGRFPPRCSLFPVPCHRSPVTCPPSPLFREAIMKTKLIVLVALITATCSAQVSLKSEPAQMPQIKNAKLETVAAAGNLQQQIEAFASRQNGTAWIGYSVPAISSHRTICCYDGEWQERSCCGTCRLSSEHNTFSGSRDDCDDAEVTNLAVLYRVEDKKIDTIRIFSQNCSIDAGGLPV